MWDIVLISVVILILYWFLVATKHPKNFPPGPRLSFPMAGDAWRLGKDMLRGFADLRQNHGDIIGLWFGPMRTVIFYDYETIMEVSSLDDSTGRPFLQSFTDIRGGTSNGSIPGVIFSTGQTWIEQRRFSLHALRDLGFGKTGMEELVKEETTALCRHLESFGRQPFNICREFPVAVLNSLWRVISNERLEYDDAKLRKLMDLLTQAIKDVGSVLFQLGMMYRPIGTIITTLGLADLTTVSLQLIKICKEAVDEHIETYQDDNMRDFLDMYIREIKNNKGNPQSSFWEEKGQLNARNICLDFFFAGSETTSTTLSWAMLYMAQYPEIQKQVQDEMLRVAGPEGRLTMADRPRTPFIEATIHEIQRCGNLIPNSVPHVTTSDLHVKGHFIPKGTQLIFYIGAIMKDPQHFPDPDKFDPTRFIAKDGSFQPNPRVVPFGTGKRRCLGETLAKMELYLFFTAILNAFKIEKEDPDVTLDEEPDFGGTFAPKPFKVRLIPRH